MPSVKCSIRAEDYAWKPSINQSTKTKHKRKILEIFSILQHQKLKLASIVKQLLALWKECFEFFINSRRKTENMNNIFIDLQSNIDGPLC